MSTTRVGPGHAAICDVATTEQAVSAHRWTVVVRWARYTGDVKFAERMAKRLGYAEPHDFTTPPARALLAEAVIDVLLGSAKSELAQEAVSVAYALGGWEAVFSLVLPEEALLAVVRAFWPDTNQILYRRGE